MGLVVAAVHNEKAGGQLETFASLVGTNSLWDDCPIFICQTLPSVAEESVHEEMGLGKSL
jgi:hypothetical protein